MPPLQLPVSHPPDDTGHPPSEIGIVTPLLYWTKTRYVQYSKGAMPISEGGPYRGSVIGCAVVDYGVVFSAKKLPANHCSCDLIL